MSPPPGGLHELAPDPGSPEFFTVLTFLASVLRGGRQGHRPPTLPQTRARLQHFPVFAVSAPSLGPCFPASLFLRERARSVRAVGRGGVSPADTLGSTSRRGNPRRGVRAALGGHPPCARPLHWPPALHIRPAVDGDYLKHGREALNRDLSNLEASCSFMRFRAYSNQW